MKILFVYFSKKQMCETAEQAIEFINGLKYRNQENQRNISVNEHTKKFCTRRLQLNGRRITMGSHFLC
ncbi:hypothetical protein [Prevotella disiens]|uniref:hypothetical protein n=1 Tax=Prevotella disiens TaxID=28130 RepID=UPI00242CC255|nr:hypothetical protein [Prevotella disiens]